MNQQNNQNRMILGAIIIVFGVLALIDNMQIFASLHVLTFWPTVFIIGGLVKIFQARHRSGYVIGGFFVGLGLILTLEHLGLLYFHIHDWWPLFLIGAGVMVLSKNSVEGDIRRRIEHRNTTNYSNIAPNGEEIPGSPFYINLASVLSGNKRRCDARDFRGGDLTSILGGTELDLSQASIVTEATLNVFAMWGGIVITVPPDWTVISQVIPVLGGAEDRTICPPVTTKRLIITGQIVMGGLEIKN